MGEVIIFEKEKADRLKVVGFRYTERKINNQTAYVFIQTKELMNELASNFEEGSFLLNKTVNF